MADKNAKLIVEALRRAAADSGAFSLIANRQTPGLFPATAAGKAAAEKACSSGWLIRVGDDFWSLSELGRKVLLAEESPKQVLEDCVRAIESRQDQLEGLRATVSRMHASLDGLRATVEQVLPALGRAMESDATDIAVQVEEILGRWEADAAEDCPLPELYRQVQQFGSSPTLGAFHDALRELHGAGRLYLHPWTGPLYAMPKPAYALLIGHDVAYYASTRAVQSTAGDEWVRSEAS